MQEGTCNIVGIILLSVIVQTHSQVADMATDKLLERMLKAKSQSRAGVESTTLGKVNGCTAIPRSQFGAVRPPSTCVSSRQLQRHATSKRSSTLKSVRTIVGTNQEHVSVDLAPFRVEELSASPRILVLRDFVAPSACDSIASQAEALGYNSKAVDYAVWTEEYAQDLRLWMSGPAVWATLGAVLAVNNGVIFADWATDNGAVPRAALFTLAAISYAGASLLGAVLAYAKVAVVRETLKGERTSQTVNLDPAACKGTEAYVQMSERLFACDRRYFERPTAVKYRPGERLAPHFDGNQPYFAPGYDAAVNKDKERGGQTLATLLLYCTDVEPEETGGRTRFAQLGVDVKPKKGDALLFFPGLADGSFDERTEHEGVAPQMSDKVIARIWRHMYDVPAPMGLAPTDKS
eukprot:gnl/MRDRNA2_/MRDRNA2_139238_c0_seq1.p1 gnl/MRDRNA2_/MRDRNA2_139238_c0~~gnl/MRDRNA2_/MRDRNA2_139238_c0_seq1.p1  ORF type:complete len:406 (-),score=63.60 gnl/MRDRNA2_/MRDRNA2_139238_c0_seq1:202-1419(-)